MRGILEAVEGDLPVHGQQCVVDAATDDRQPLAIVPGALNQPLDQQCLAEGRRRLGDGYRRRGVKGSARRGEYSVKAVAEFVGHRQHITDAAAVVQQHVWMHGARAVTEGPRELRRSRRRVDPALIEETCDDRARRR